MKEVAWHSQDWQKAFEGFLKNLNNLFNSWEDIIPETMAFNQNIGRYANSIWSDFTRVDPIIELKQPIMLDNAR